MLAITPLLGGFFLQRNLEPKKIFDSEQGYIKRKILGLNFNASYNFENETFGDLISKIHFKKL